MYYKIIGRNHGKYPYRVGLNTLKHNNEKFNDTKECEAGGLYYTDVEHIFEYLCLGDKVCIVKLPKGAKQVKIDNQFKSDKIIIEEILPLNLDTIKMLVKNGAYVEPYSTMMRASRFGHTSLVKYLVEECGVNVRDNAFYGIKWAAENGHLEIVKYLAEKGVDVRAGDDNAIRWAAIYKHSDVVEYLKRNYYNKNNKIEIFF